MENIYDIRKKENPLYILDENIIPDFQIQEKKVAVIIYLYYLDTIERYIPNIDNIPEEIPAYVFSSNKQVLDKVKRLCKKQNVMYKLKENRGRDVSALLVAARNIVEKYDYFCFIHDKKEKKEYLKKDIEIWANNLWDNTIKNENYIHNVIKLFEESDNIGLLVPPIPLSDNLETWYQNAWYGNFDNACSLAKRLNLNVKLERNASPICIGTVFWARTVALKRILEYKWDYNDFPEEPLAIDGTISHAIERIFSYVAMDAGYETKTIMCEEYAEYMLETLEHIMGSLFSSLSACYNINGHCDGIQMKKFLECYQERKEYDKLYIYGTGKVGELVYCLLTSRKKQITSFIVSQNGNNDKLYDLPVKSIDSLHLKPQDLVVIATGVEYAKQIELELLKRNHMNYIKFYDCERMKE